MTPSSSPTLQQVCTSLKSTWKELRKFTAQEALVPRYFFLLSKDILLPIDVSGLWVRLEGGGGPEEPVEDPHNGRVGEDAVQAGAGEGVCATEVLLDRQGLQVLDPATQSTLLTWYNQE